MVAQAKNAKSGLVRILPLENICPSPENDQLYKPVDPNDPEIQALALSIRERGLLEPLVITLDHFILSGHRRYVAAKLAGLKEVPTRTEPIRSSDPQFVRLLREYNRQREKTIAEKIREEVVSANPEEAHRALRRHRERASRIEVETVELEGWKVRSEISEAKIPFSTLASGLLMICASTGPCR